MQLRNRFEVCTVLVLIYGGGTVYHTTGHKMHQQALLCKIQRTNLPDLCRSISLAGDIRFGALLPVLILQLSLVLVTPPNNLDEALQPYNSILFSNEYLKRWFFFNSCNCSYSTRASAAYVSLLTSQASPTRF